MMKMGEQLASLNLKNPLLNEVAEWMDGGSVTLYLVDDNATAFEVEFCQTMILENRTYLHIPGSFLFNREEVSIRSDSEKVLLTAIRNLRFKETIPVEEQIATKSLIEELVAFVESDEYLRIATLMGRL